jgi:adenosine deaminase
MPIMKSEDYTHPGAATMSPRNISEFIRSLPKTEIHIHAEATVSFGSYFVLNEKYKADPSLKSPSDFHKLFKMDSLSVMIKNFLYLQSFFRASEDFALVVADVESYARRNNIRYMELFVAPSMVLKQGAVDFSGIMDPLVDGFSRLAASGGPDIKLLVDVSRTFGLENATRNFNFLHRYLTKRSTDRILGIGLGGTENGNPCKEYKSVFESAKEAGLHVVAHAGEEVGPESIRQAVEALGAERIGHGTSAIQDPKVMDLLRDRGVALEICPTSNVVTGKYVKKYEDHPLKQYYDRGMLVTINTDDPVLFDVELNQELERSAASLKFDKTDILAILKNGIKASFMDEKAKAAAYARLDEAVPAAKTARSA